MKALAEKAEGLARRLSRGIWFSPSAVREQSQIGSWENWKIWSENKPFSSQSPFFFSGLGPGRQSGSSHEGNLRNGIKAKACLWCKMALEQEGVGGAVLWKC